VENFKVIAQGHHTFVRGELVVILAFQPMLGAAPCPQLDRCAQNFCGVIDYIILSTKVKMFRFSDSFSFGDIKSSISLLAQWHGRYLASYRSNSKVA